MNFSLADVVKSIKGRDAGRYFVIVGILDENYVLVADGDLRKIDCPKKKRRKHLKEIELHSDFLAGKLLSGQKLTNADLRKNLEALLLETNLDKEGFHGERRCN